MITERFNTHLGYNQLSNHEHVSAYTSNITQDSRKKITVSVVTRAKFGSGIFHIEGVYPEIAKYVRTEKNQQMDDSRLKIGCFLKKYEMGSPVIFYIPLDMTFRSFLEDIGFDTNLYYYVGNYLITKEDMELPLDILSKCGPLRQYACFTMSKRKYFWTKYDWSNIKESDIRSFYGEFY